MVAALTPKAGTAISDRPMPQDEQAGSHNLLVPCAIKVPGLSALPFTAQFIPFAALPGSDSARPALPGGARAQDQFPVQHDRTYA